MSVDKNPKIFISYSWSSDALVVPLAQRLVSHGVEVVLDKWDLKEGQDKYAFMEQCVNDPDITKVLIVCDEAYAKKANNRIGGVGDETIIISSEVYGQMKQEKFIPIIAERGDDGESFVPTYIKSRIYIDLSNEETFEEEYEKLLRNIYDKPLHIKPKLGKRPEWLDEEKTNLFPLTDLIRQIKGTNNAKKQSSCVNKFVEEYIETLKTYYEEGLKAKKVYEKYIETKPVRDVFLDFLPALAGTEESFADVISDTFEKMYNALTNGKGMGRTTYSVSGNDYEIYKILIWELFICTIAYLRHVEDYKSINGIVSRTYFLNVSWNDGSVTPYNYCKFRHHSEIIESYYKPTTEHQNKFTLVGHTLCTEREKLPIYSKEAIAQADLFLYQIKNAFTLVEVNSRYGESYWFPTCYIYCYSTPAEWIKIKSLRYCEKMYELFGVSNLAELKKCISNCTGDRDMGYKNGAGTAFAILDYIKLEEIGSMN